MRSAALLGLAPWLVACGDPSAPAPQDLDIERLFDADHVLEVSLALDAGDLDALSQQSRNILDLLAGECTTEPFGSPFTFFPASLVIDGVERAEVGARKKGFLGSLSTERPSLKIDLEEFLQEQELAGLEKLTFNNSQQDPSRLRSCLTYQVFNDAGLPAARCNFAHLTVNGEDQGVYVHVETVNKDFLRARFADPEGDLFEGTLSDFRPGLLGTFEKDTNKDEPDSGALQALADALTVEDAQLLDALEPLVDLDQFFTFWAMEYLVGHVDGYAGNINNFYLYQDPSDGKLRFIVHGVDGTFLDASFLGGAQTLNLSLFANGSLARRLLLLPEGQARLFATLQGLLDTVWDEDRLLAEVDRMEALLAPFGDSDAAGRDQVRGFIQTRRAVVEAELAAGVAALNPQSSAPCFPVVGDASGSFSTTFGTLDDADIFGTGDATLDLVLDGAEVALSSLAGAAGPDSNDPRIPSVRVVGVREDGLLELVILLFPDGFAPGVQRFDLFSAAPQGFVATFDLNTSEFVIQGVLAGAISLEEASTSAGAAIEGNFAGEVVLIPGL